MTLNLKIVLAKKDRKWKISISPFFPPKPKSGASIQGFIFALEHIEHYWEIAGCRNTAVLLNLATFEGHCSAPCSTGQLPSFSATKNSPWAEGVFCPWVDEGFVQLTWLSASAVKRQKPLTMLQLTTCFSAPFSAMDIFQKQVTPHSRENVQALWVEGNLAIGTHPRENRAGLFRATKSPLTSPEECVQSVMALLFSGLRQVLSWGVQSPTRAFLQLLKD